MTKFIVKFDYNTESLVKVVEESKKIDLTNISEVTDFYRKLVKTRTTITKQGKSHRDEANAYNKAVLIKEKEYLAIIQPTELEFKKIIDDEKKRKEKEERKKTLPVRKKQLESLEIKISDDEILEMNDTQFNSFYSEEFDKKREKELFEKNRIEQEKKEQADRKKFEEDTRKRLEQEARDREKKKIEDEKREQKALAKKAEFKKFLDENNFNKKTDKLVDKDGVVGIYRLVAEFRK